LQRSRASREAAGQELLCDKGTVRGVLQVAR